MPANNSLTVQIKRGTSAQTASYTGPLAELIVDTDQKTLTIQDGVTPGGVYLARLDFAQAAYNTANIASSSPYAQGAYAQANTATTIAQNSYNLANTTNTTSIGAYNQANTATNLAQGAFNLANTSFSSYGGTISGSVVIQHDLTVSGNVTYTGNTTSVQITGNTGQFFGYTANGFNALYAGIPTGYLIQPQTITQFTANYDGYAGVNHQNINSGANSSSDIFLTADNGTFNDGYIDLGIASSQYNYPGFNIIKPNDGYFYVAGNTTTGGGNLVIGTYLNNDIVFTTNGLNTNDEVMRINSANNVVIKSNNQSTGLGTGALQVGGGATFGGNVYIANTTSFGSETFFNFQGDQQQISVDSSVLRMGSWSNISGPYGTLYNLVGEQVMWYWIHNCSINPITGNFNNRDDAGPVTVWALGEDMVIKTYVSPGDTTNSIPTIWTQTSTQDTNNGLFNTGGVKSNAIQTTQIATPSSISPTIVPTGGNLGPGTYYVRLVVIDQNGQPTLPGPESAITISSGTLNSINYTYTAVAGSSAYRFYVSQTSGIYNSGYFQISPDFDYNYFTLTTLSGTTAGILPTVNNTGGIFVPYGPSMSATDITKIALAQSFIV